MTTIGKTLRALMDREQLTERAVAKRCGLSQKAINNVLRGHRDPKWETTIVPLAKAFRLPPWLLVMPGLDLILDDARRLADIVTIYCAACADGRAVLHMVASREAAQQQKPKK
jgi:transcriptional regulator with XRE-family HTH domain